MTYRSPRDPVTGVPLHLTRDAVVMRVRDRYAADADDERDIPSKIDRSEDYHTDEAGVTARKEARGYNGGLAWSGGFERYMRGVLPTSISEAKRVWTDWWLLPNVVAGLAAQMDAGAFECAMLFWRDGLELDEVATVTQHSYRYVIRAKVAAKRIVREQYLPHRLMREELPAFAASLRTRQGA